MDWLPFAAGAAVALATADFSVKLAAGQIGSQIGALIYSLTTLVISGGWVLISRANGAALKFTPEGLLPALVTGVAFAFVTIFLYLTFATGVNISLAIPAIRIAGILMASALGVIFAARAADVALRRRRRAGAGRNLLYRDALMAPTCDALPKCVARNIHRRGRR